MLLDRTEKIVVFCIAFFAAELMGGDAVCAGILAIIAMRLYETR